MENLRHGQCFFLSSGQFNNANRSLFKKKIVIYQRFSFTALQICMWFCVCLFFFLDHFHPTVFTVCFCKGKTLEKSFHWMTVWTIEWMQMAGWESVHLLAYQTLHYTQFNMVFYLFVAHVVAITVLHFQWRLRLIVYFGRLFCYFEYFDSNRMRTFQSNKNK